MNMDLYLVLEKGKSLPFIQLCEMLPKEMVLNARDKRDESRGKCLLHLACRNGFCDMAAYLIKCGHDVNAIDSSSTLVTPLMEAIMSSNAEISQSLIEAGARLGKNYVPILVMSTILKIYFF
jgi:hypothetical protein